ncbi:uncharacterized protein LOC108597982 [Drosophila busckii]|uniref:uncharacterized protein LOC108597982 n=1 Tax=Drosophila busckii TaxID=30019 RepID=UPI00083F4EC3|nr:uncharacterized protein LOC108597982 [Drosophila busckii]
MLGTKDGISIRYMQLEDYPSVKLFMRDNYWSNGEPLSAAAPAPAPADIELQKCNEQLRDEYYLKTIAQGFSILALDEQGQIVGQQLAEAVGPNYLDIYRKCHSLEQNYYVAMRKLLHHTLKESQIFERYAGYKMLYTRASAVRSDMRGQGLGKRLLATTIEIAKQHNFELLASACSSYYSAKLRLSLGMQCIYALAYKDYKDEQGVVPFQPSEPHTHSQVFVLQLKL